MVAKKNYSGKERKETEIKIYALDIQQLGIFNSSPTFFKNQIGRTVQTAFLFHNMPSQMLITLSRSQVFFHDYYQV